MKRPLFQEKLKIGQNAIKTIVAQDLHVDEMIPIGLRSRFAVRGRCCWQERAQREIQLLAGAPLQEGLAGRQGGCPLCGSHGDGALTVHNLGL